MDLTSCGSSKLGPLTRSKWSGTGADWTKRDAVASEGPGIDDEEGVGSAMLVEVVMVMGWREGRVGIFGRGADGRTESESRTSGLEIEGCLEAKVVHFSHLPLSSLTLIVVRHGVPIVVK